MHTLRFTAVAVAAAFAFGSALAQSAGSAPPSGSGGAGTSATGGGAAPAAQPGSGTRNSETRKDDKLARGDRQFVLKAAGSGMFEVQAAQLAASKATDPDVKSFAGMLADHHAKANDELTRLANAKGVELPAAPPRALRREVEKLGKKDAREFDQAFVKEVGIQAHEKDIKLFDKASRDLKDPELKAFAAKTLPTLKEHLAQAQKLPGAGKQGDAARMGAGSAPAGGTGGGNGANKTGS